MGEWLAGLNHSGGNDRTVLDPSSGSEEGEADIDIPAQ